MTLLFTRTFRGYCEVINWFNFSNIVSPGLGRPKERGKDGGIVGQWSSQNTCNIYQLILLSYMGTVGGNPKCL